MIQPEEIREKANRLYPKFLRAWLNGDESFFPRVVPANRDLDPRQLAEAIEQVQRLRASSKEALGYGYSVIWEERRSKDFGSNQFPKRIQFESVPDFLRFIRRESEFRQFTQCVERLHAEFPELRAWVQSNCRRLVEHAAELDGLLEVLRHFRAHPRPGCYARELRLGVDTKFIERHQDILRAWFDLVLPPHAIRADESHFERRYGLKYVEPLVMVRLLDPVLQREIGAPWPEFALPLSKAADLPLRSVRAVIVENKVNLLTLPPLDRTVGLGGLGSAVTDLRHLVWLHGARVVYWGDADLEGFEILSGLRSVLPHVESAMMDRMTLNQHRTLAVKGNGSKRASPPYLTGAELRADETCRDSNLRLEQERISQAYAASMLGRLLSPIGVREERESVTE